MVHLKNESVAKKTSTYYTMQHWAILPFRNKRDRRLERSKCHSICRKKNELKRALINQTYLRIGYMREMNAAKNNLNGFFYFFSH